MTQEIVPLNPLEVILSWNSCGPVCFQVTNWPLPLTHRQRTLAFSSQGWPGCSGGFFSSFDHARVRFADEEPRTLKPAWAWPRCTWFGMTRVHWIDVYFKFCCYASARCYGPFQGCFMGVACSTEPAQWMVCIMKAPFLYLVKLVCGATWASFWWLRIENQQAI